MNSSSRRTKIIATAGPASDEADELRKMLEAGADVIRINFSHSSHDYARIVTQRVRDIAAELERPVAILQDLCGPKIRTGDLADGPVELRPGAKVTITTEPVAGTAERISTSYANFARDVAPGNRVLLDDGAIELKAISTSATEVETEVVFGGTLHEHKGINLPGVRLSCPSVTEKDRADLELGVELGMDYIALSFVRCGDEVEQLRRLIEAHGADIPVIAKIEKPEALEDLDAILRHSDAIMVARGDLGVELAPEKVPMVQKDIIKRSNIYGVVVITATQMLESMISNPRPTRAEASDVANAILDGTDAVMLSAETSIGRYPALAVKTMAGIARQVEAAEPFADLLAETRLQSNVTFEDAAADAACHAAETADARAIVVFTMSGKTAAEVSQRRPEKPIYALTPLCTTCERMALFWGVAPVISPQARRIDEQLRFGEEKLMQLGLIEKGDIIIVVIGTSPVKGATDTVKIHRVMNNE